MGPASALGLLAHSLLRGNGWGIVLHIEAHFDESGTDASELTLAGYLFEAGQIDRFCGEWNAMLEKYRIPFFHMVDCAHGVAPFDHLEKLEALHLQIRAMRLIKDFSVNGIVCNVKNKLDNRGSSYLDAVELGMRAVMEWADGTAYHGKIAYFFEGGANGEGLAEASLGQIARDPGKVAAHRYAGHAFVPKTGNPGVQAADLLAWQYQNFTKKRTKDSLARLDLRALLRHPHKILDDCGEPPRASEVQSVNQSRDRTETIFYLPSIHKSETKGRSVLTGNDTTLFRFKGSSTVLACPNCWRAICEASPENVRNIVFRCWCGTYCEAPRAMAPFSYS